jgi:hypothetical protein
MNPLTLALRRPIIGGLIAATLATLFVLPSVFVLAMRGTKAGPPSIHPDDLRAKRAQVAPSQGKE